MDVDATIRDEQRRVDAALAAGATYLVNRSSDVRHRVHTLECETVRTMLDRAATWDQLLMTARGDGGLATYLARGGFVPKMPLLLTRVQVEELSTYHRCKVCAPDTDHARKSAAERPVRVGDLKERHFGRQLVAMDGTELGTLERITTERWPGRIVITVHTERGAHQLGQDLRLFARTVT